MIGKNKAIYAQLAWRRWHINYLFDLVCQNIIEIDDDEEVLNVSTIYVYTSHNWWSFWCWLLPWPFKPHIDFKCQKLCFHWIYHPQKTTKSGSRPYMMLTFRAVFFTFRWPLSPDLDIGAARNYHISTRHPWIPIRYQHHDAKTHTTISIYIFFLLPVAILDLCYLEGIVPP